MYLCISSIEQSSVLILILVGVYQLVLEPGCSWTPFMVSMLSMEVSVEALKRGFKGLLAMCETIATSVEC